VSGNDLGRLLLVVGLGLSALGAVLMLGGGRLPFGRLPGDIVIQRPNMTILVPLGSCLVLSVLLSGAMWLVGWWSSHR
jgi:hypothetical protein